MAKIRSLYLWTRAVSTVMPFEWFTLIALVGVFGEIGGSTIAIVGTAEKGYMDTMVKVSTAGGHSSVPPAHTVRCNLSPMDFI
jgi:acetylornithine deacetylase/succinyl-diaminopimelate desuccinylase-like protein